MVAQLVVSMDEKGHLILPEETRRALHLEGEAKFTVVVTDNVVVLRPVAPVADTIPAEDAWAYTAESRRHIEAARQQFREGRILELTEDDLERLVGEEQP